MRPRDQGRKGLDREIRLASRAVMDDINGEYELTFDDRLPSRLDYWLDGAAYLRVATLPDGFFDP